MYALTEQIAKESGSSSSSHSGCEDPANPSHWMVNTLIITWDPRNCPGPEDRRTRAYLVSQDTKGYELWGDSYCKGNPYEFLGNISDEFSQ